MRRTKATYKSTFFFIFMYYLVFVGVEGGMKLSIEKKCREMKKSHKSHQKRKEKSISKSLWMKCIQYKSTLIASFPSPLPSFQPSRCNQSFLMALFPHIKFDVEFNHIYCAHVQWQCLWVWVCVYIISQSPQFSPQYEVKEKIEKNIMNKKYKSWIVFRLNQFFKIQDSPLDDVCNIFCWVKNIFYRNFSQSAISQ